VSATSAKKKAVLERTLSIEEALVRARQYLESGEHADWHGFRALFVPKRRNGKEVPPHKDWVKNVFIPRMEKALHQSEMALERLGQKDTPRAG
jgi:hypothetical protein